MFAHHKPGHLDKRANVSVDFHLIFLLFLWPNCGLILFELEHFYSKNWTSTTTSFRQSVPGHFCSAAIMGFDDVQYWVLCNNWIKDNAINQWKLHENLNDEWCEDVGLFTSACYDVEFLSLAPILIMFFSTVFYFWLYLFQFHQSIFSFCLFGYFYIIYI